MSDNYYETQFETIANRQQSYYVERKEIMTETQMHQRGSGRTQREFAHLVGLAHTTPDKKYAYVFHTNAQKILVTKDYPTNIVVGCWEQYKAGKFHDFDEVFFDHDLQERIIGKCGETVMGWLIKTGEKAHICDFPISPDSGELWAYSGSI